MKQELSQDLAVSIFDRLTMRVGEEFRTRQHKVASMIPCFLGICFHLDIPQCTDEQGTFGFVVSVVLVLHG